MTTEISTYYSIHQFQGWVATDATSYVLPTDVMDVIHYLEKNVEIPDAASSAISSQRFQPVGASHHSKMHHRASAAATTDDYRSHSHHRSADLSRKPARHDRMSSSHGKNHRVPTMEDWEMTRQFKTTKFEAKIGVEKQINDIRIILNKISSTNYEKQRDLILQHIRGFFTEESDDKEENVRKIAQAIFDIASSNKFYSELYAKLYKELIAEFAIFDTLITTFIANFNSTIATIQYVDPDENYDEFCRINKDNDKRKATAAFIIHLMKQGIVSMDSILGIVQVFLDTILAFIKETDKGKVVEEVTENLFIMITTCKTQLKEQPLWSTDIYPHIQRLSNASIKADNPSISNRVIFKFMDLV